MTAYCFVSIHMLLPTMQLFENIGVMRSLVIYCVFIFLHSPKPVKQQINIMHKIYIYSKIRKTDQNSKNYFK